MFAHPMAAIAFPDIDPVLISLGPLSVHWYGIGYVAGILFGWWYAKRLVSDPRLWPSSAPDRLPIQPVDIDDFVVWAVLGIILGGRLGYVLFYDLAVYLDDPMRIFALQQGGMSFHGGLTGIVIAMIVFARRRGFSVFSLFDMIAASCGIGIFLVRVANFINQELYGKPTEFALGVIFPVTGDGVPRHPSQLYEGLLEGLVLFGLMRLLTHRFLKLADPGFVGGAYLFGYAIARIAVEFVRLPDPQIGYLAGGWLTMGMVLSVPVLLAGLWAMVSAPGRRPATRG
ncbi:MAG: prolipoprotein diacylglyceryl transferase [Nitratireductor sp.]|nr:prolipoprotein diacylglyceryl transferase [Nitratireductor sp.]